MLQQLKAWLLDLANADPPAVGRERFYAQKQALLLRHACLVGWDWQCIKKKCWGEHYWDRERDQEVSRACGPTCRRCGGTGLWEVRYHLLERWRWCGHVFHMPVRSTYVKPESPITIHGRINHQRDGWKHREALLWLYLLCGQWWLLWGQLNSGCCLGKYLWPLLTLQRCLWRLRGWRDWLRWEWEIRRTRHKPKVPGDEDIPF